MTALELIQKFPNRYEIHKDETGRHPKEVIYWLMAENKDGTYSRVIGSEDSHFSGIEFLPSERGELGTIFI